MWLMALVYVYLFISLLCSCKMTRSGYFDFPSLTVEALINSTLWHHKTHESVNNSLVCILAFRINHHLRAVVHGGKYTLDKAQFCRCECIGCLTLSVLDAL